MAKQDILWNFYKKGIITNETLTEIKRINLDKDLRKAKLDSGPLSTCKSEQMAVYATLQIVESLFTKVDELFYGTYKGTMSSFDTTNTYVLNVQKQMGTVMQGLKTSETNLRNAISQNAVNTAKLLKQETLRINKIISILESSGANKNITEGFRSDLKKATKVIREGSSADLKELEQTIIRTLHKRDEAFVKAVGEQYKDLVTEMGKAPKGKGDKADSHITDQLEGLSENLDILGDKLEGIQTNLADALESKAEGGNEKVLEILEDNAQENAELNEAQTQVITEHIENLQADVDGLQDNMDKRFKKLETNFDKFKKTSNDNVVKEVKDLRELLNTMRADIELMKTIVSKLGK